MKAEELIKKLSEVDPKMEIFCTSNTGEWDYGRVYTAESKFISIEDAEEETLVFIIDEQ